MVMVSRYPAPGPVPGYHHHLKVYSRQGACFAKMGKELVARNCLERAMTAAKEAQPDNLDTILER